MKLFHAPARRIAGLLLAAGLAAPLSAQTVVHFPALDRANLDTTCAPCNDFFTFANGGWAKRATIPAAYASYGSFQELADRNEAVLHEILEQGAAAVKAGRLVRGSGEWKTGTFYATCMDSAAIDRRGVAALQPDLDIVARIGSVLALTQAFGALERRVPVSPWYDGPNQDARDAPRTIAALYQGGLTLPNKEYYFKTDSASVAIRASYLAHVGRMFVLLGDAPATAASEARTVMAIETRLADASRTPVELRDPVANYHRMSLAEVNALTPHFSWTTFYRQIGVAAPARIDVGQPAFFRAFDAMLTTVPVSDWRTYLRWRLVHGSAASLSAPFVNEDFTFNKLFSGATEILPRWKRCVASTDNRLGELLGEQYVKRTFTPEAKARAVKIVDNLVTELGNRIGKLDWMSAPTKAQAMVKLNAFTRKIGYPDHWRDYSALTVRGSNYLADVRAADQWAMARSWAKIGKPTNRTDWGMTPPTVNAYENPQLNEIVFPAGILQPPFFNPDADDAVNYGAMGAVIGHEMGHAFDDQGRQYDADGNLRDWWTKEDGTRYDSEAQKIVTQFNAYTVLDTATHVNGKLTLGENIGDFGGLTVAYAAMERALGSAPRTRIDGFTPEQRFFLGWAQVWREVARPEFERWLVSANEHSPARWRVNGPLSNMPEFKAAFGCSESDAMVRVAAVRPRIW